PPFACLLVILGSGAVAHACRSTIAIKVAPIFKIELILFIYLSIPMVELVKIKYLRYLFIRRNITIFVVIEVILKDNFIVNNFLK
ncbi:hypothetical protein ACVQPQ_19360, partial [Acinetobacter baumannii]